MPTQCNKRGKNAELKLKSNEEWKKRSKCVPKIFFCKKQNNKGENNDDHNVNNNMQNFKKTMQ